MLPELFAFQVEIISLWEISVGLDLLFSEMTLIMTYLLLLLLLLLSRSVVSDSVQAHGLQPTRLLSPWDFPGKSIGMGCRCLLP